MSLHAKIPDTTRPRGTASNLCTSSHTAPPHHTHCHGVWITRSTPPEFDCIPVTHLVVATKLTPAMRQSAVVLATGLDAFIHDGPHLAGRVTHGQRPAKHWDGGG